MESKVIKNDMTIAIIHDGAEVGEMWKTFMEELFTVDLPENCRDMGLDVVTMSIEDLDDDGIGDSDALCPWRLFLLSFTMLDVIKDENSTLRKGDLFVRDPDRIIILILGEQNDTSFLEDVRRSLCVYPNFFQFHLVPATSTEKIISDIIMIVSPLNIVFHPNILSAESKGQHVTLIANKAYPNTEGIQFIVEFSDETSTVEIEASLFNPCTLLLDSPDHQPGVVDVKVYVCTRVLEGDEDKVVVMKNQLGESMKAWFQSDLDKVHAILERNNNPFNFLCQSLKLNPNGESTSEQVDKVLTDAFRKHVPDNQLARVFGTDQGVQAEGYEGNSKEYAPTLLHFAAMHGLCTLTAMLLRCPGSVRAFGTANCDGDYPTNLAEKFGHWDLKQYMQSYMEVSAMVDYEMGSPYETSQMMAQMVTGQYLSVSESIYGSETYGGVASSETPPGYLHMKPFPANSIEEVCYDKPFIVPIPLADDTPNYESIIARMIETEDPYMSFLQNESDPHNYGDVSEEEDEVPPPPPRNNMWKDEYPPPPPPTSSASSPPPPVGRYTESPPPRPEGADRVEYGSLSIPKIYSYASPAQRELIILQQKVKNNELTTNQAVSRFKEWERKHKEQAASFQFQQECLQRVRMSLMKSKELKRSRGEDDKLEITGPIVAGSSTYDHVLRKTNVSDPAEAVYGSTSKHANFDDGFCRSLSVRSHDPNLPRVDAESHPYRPAQAVYKSVERNPPPVPPRDVDPTDQPPYVPPRPPRR